MKPVKLAVLLVFDQFRGDYPARWKAQYGPDGLNRFLEQGAWYSNAHYPYAVTVTGAGHASLVAGAAPARYLALRWNNWRYKFLRSTDGEGGTYTSLKQGGGQIEFEDEDTSMRKMYEEECAKNGVKVDMG